METHTGHRGRKEGLLQKKPLKILQKTTTDNVWCHRGKKKRPKPKASSRGHDRKEKGGSKKQVVDRQNAGVRKAFPNAQNPRMSRKRVTAL